MKTKSIINYGLFFILVIFFALPLYAQNNSSAVPSIEGTYLFVSRDYSDTAQNKGTDVKGMLTYTKEYRSFNISWLTGDGKHFSIAYFCKYQLTADSYRETPISFMLYDEAKGAPNYDLPASQADAASVTFKDGKTTFKLLYENVTLTFDANGFTAVSPQGFTDHWKKVK